MELAAPFSFTRRRCRRLATPVKGELGYSHLEKLQNLEMLPADGFEIVCCPVEVHRASAGWTRAVTILPA
jgi:hypothetical protein